MAALPLYVHLPKFYGGELAMPLAIVGAILLATRVLDAISDPLIGYLCDRTGARRAPIWLAMPLLAFGMFGLFRPPSDSS